MIAEQKQIAIWKQKHGDVFSVSVKNKDYIFRRITPIEYGDIADTSGDSAEMEDEILKLALLDPNDFDMDHVPAGIVSVLVKEILDVSGFGSPYYVKELLETAREQIVQSQGMMKAFILATMPAYKEEDLDEMNIGQLANKVALAEQIIKVNQSAFGAEENDVKLQIIDPEEERLKEQEEAAKHAAQKKPGQASYHDPIAQKLQQALGG